MLLQFLYEFPHFEITSFQLVLLQIFILLSKNFESKIEF
ncbi:hypothetical protein LEP1GSC186_1798 [Leptospira noguchii serovar Autumnalis str. ZUN142]|uniref:Uncharacterized protein n=1 Tax=Leptospira noguchii serovar Autumnalis str. ZUN142 TaxID=1085540 RepID=M6UWD9_9LEPT|nr:hypothetical protein LEP1GSC186_1798 [Leptospira noguchii serovar Autumnalis str. ZUN142]